MATVSISKRIIEKQKGVVILSLKEYQKLCEKAVLTYCLKGEEAGKLDKLVEEGLNDYRRGKCKTIKSLADLE